MADDPSRDEAVTDTYAALRERYERGEELTDEDIDVIADVAVGYVRGILSFFGAEGVAIDEYEGDDGELILDVNGGDLAVLIGRHGRTLDSFQMVVSSLMSSTLRFHAPSSDAIQLRNAAARAKRQHSKVSLPPMNAYERRLIHLALVDDDEVTTHSEGEDPTRHVVITALRA